LINGPTNAISLVVFSVLLSFDARFEHTSDVSPRVMVAASDYHPVFNLGDLTRYISESGKCWALWLAGLLVAIGQWVTSWCGECAGQRYLVLGRSWQTVMESGPVNPMAIGLVQERSSFVLVLRRVINRCGCHNWTCFWD